MTIARPTHCLTNPDGSTETVFAHGYPTDRLTPLPDGYWQQRDLADRLAMLIAEVDAERERRVNGGLTTPFGALQTDKDSRDLIAAARDDAMEAKAMNSAAWRITWRLADNSVSPPLTADNVIAIARAVRAYGLAVIAASFPIKDALRAATTIEQLAAVNLSASYPPAVLS